MLGCCRDYLVDYVGGRYGEPYQSAYRTDQVLQLPLKVAQGQGEWDTTGLPQALREFPPTVTAAGWLAQVCRTLLLALTSPFVKSRLARSCMVFDLWVLTQGALCPG